MSNIPSWLSRWARSPRQDRRVIENGRFVEQGKVQLPEPPPVEVPEREQSALEIVREPINVPEQEQPTESIEDATNPVVSPETVNQAIEHLKTPEGVQAFIKAFNDSANDPSQLLDQGGFLDDGKIE